jgi:hypothetical protein
MEWIIKIEEEKNQRIKVTFDPLAEKINVFGEARVKNNEWSTFSWFIHGMEISLDELQKKMEQAVVTMRKRLKEYENLNKGFSVLKLVAFEEDETIDE